MSESLPPEARSSYVLYTAVHPRISNDDLENYLLELLDNKKGFELFDVCNYVDIKFNNIYEISHVIVTLKLLEAAKKVTLVSSPQSSVLFHKRRG